MLNFQVPKCSSTVLAYNVQDPYTQTVYAEFEDTLNVNVHSVYPVPDRQHDRKMYACVDAM